MIEKLKKIFDPDYMIRPLVYQAFTKIGVAFVFILLWSKFTGRVGAREILVNLFFVTGAIYLMLLWFQYLRLDGIQLKGIVYKRKRKKPIRNGLTDIADFADEKILSFAELEDDERMVVRFLSDLVAAIFYLVPALIAYIVFQVI